MSSRRSSRSTPKKAISLPPSVRLGLESLVEGNEATIGAMLSIAQSETTTSTCFEKLIDAMAVNALSAEALLARFFDEGTLGEYCTAQLGKSAKGNAATLAARIAREWAKPAFKPRAKHGGAGGGGQSRSCADGLKGEDAQLLVAAASGQEGAGGGGAAAAALAASSGAGCPPAKRPRLSGAVAAGTSGAVTLPDGRRGMLAGAKAGAFTAAYVDAPPTAAAAARYASMDAVLAELERREREGKAVGDDAACATAISRPRGAGP